MDAEDIPSYEISYKRQMRISLIKRRCKNRIIPIHRHRYYEIVIITNTKDEIQSHEIDFIPFDLTAGHIYFISPNQTHKWNFKEYKEQFDGFIINFNEAFILENSDNIKPLLLKLFNPFNSSPYLVYDIKRFKTIFPIMDVLLNEYNKKEQNSSILRSLLETLLYYMEELKKESPQIIDSNFKKLNRVKNLIEENYKEIKETEFYAKKMELSSKRLNEIVKKVSGFTVTQMIHQRLILEAKRMMVSQDKTIQEIAYNLGFENPSYFARFFKKHETISPKEYSVKMLK